MTKPPQQTIGNTVYTVGQELNNYTEAAPLLDYMYKNFPNFEFYRAIGWVDPISISFCRPSFPMLITALPNPDPVEDEWRVVELGAVGHHYKGYLKGGTVFTERHALQLAMQEVCKADEVETSGLERYGICDMSLEKGDGYDTDEIDWLIRCFLLGGVVKVRGGL
jgi:hypothetical protein